MDTLHIVLALLKILLIVAFLLQTAAIATWLERRQAALIQDRVGPNRAVAVLPAKAMRALLPLAGVGLGGLALAGAFALRAHVVAAAALGLVGLALVALLVRAGTRVADGGVELRLAGLLHPIADSVKFITKEDFIPPNADKLLHSLGPMIALFPALVTFAVVPFGEPLCVRFGQGGFFDALARARVPLAVEASGVCSEGGVALQIANLDVGILYVFALAGTGIIGAAIAGWSSDNKYSLMGGLRAASQMVSYEVAMGLALVGAFMTYGSLRLDDMVVWQRDHAWGIFVQPLAFVLFLAAAIAEQKRVPFDAPEGESEIVAGYFVEYSGMKFAMFMTGEYVEIIFSSALLVTIFLGGYTLPFVQRDGITLAFGDQVLGHLGLSHPLLVALSALVFFGKTLLVTFLQIFIRWTVPRFRYDQIMKLGWRVLLPGALVNMLVTGVLLLAVDAAPQKVLDALHVLGDVSKVVVAAVGSGLVLWFAVWVVRAPAAAKKTVVSTSAKTAAERGGIQTEPMQA